MSSTTQLMEAVSTETESQLRAMYRLGVLAGQELRKHSEPLTPIPPALSMRPVCAKCRSLKIETDTGWICLQCLPTPRPTKRQSRGVFKKYRLEPLAGWQDTPTRLELPAIRLELVNALH
jgi:hypothetical protein